MENIKINIDAVEENEVLKDGTPIKDFLTEDGKPMTIKKSELLGKLMELDSLSEQGLMLDFNDKGELEITIHNDYIY